MIRREGSEQEQVDKLYAKLNIFSDVNIEDKDYKLRDGSEVMSITGLDNGESTTAKVTATRADGSSESFEVNVGLQTPKEREYVRHGGVLHYVLRQLAAQSKDAA